MRVAIDRRPRTTMTTITNKKPLLCIAHRGGRKLGLENTLTTIQKALALGVDAIEIDVWHIGGQLIVTHDRELGRTIKGDGRVPDLDPNEIKQLQHYDGSPVNTLAEVIDAVVGKALLNIELKGPDCAPAVAKLINQQSKAQQLNPEDIIVSSFDHAQLFWLKNNAPTLKRGVLVYGQLYDGIACCDALGAYSFHPSVDFIDPSLIRAANDKGLQVWVYTVNREDDFRDLQAIGVTGVFTDDPELLIKYNKTFITS